MKYLTGKCPEPVTVYLAYKLGVAHADLTDKLFVRHPPLSVYSS